MDACRKSTWSTFPPPADMDAFSGERIKVVSSRWSIGCVLILAIMNVHATSTLATYSIEDHCQSEISMILDGVYQARVTFDSLPAFPSPGANNTASPHCRVSIETWYSSPHIMFYFEDINMDCQDGYLEFLDGSDPDATYVEDLKMRGCDIPLPSGVFVTQSRYLTIAYVASRPVRRADVFSIVVTSFSLEPCKSIEYLCDNGRCISGDISCSTTNPCGDHSSCRNTLPFSTLTLIIVCSGVAFVVLVCICCMAVRHHRDQIKAKAKKARARSSSQKSVNSVPKSPHPPQSPESSAAPVAIVAGQRPGYPSNIQLPLHTEGEFKHPENETESHGMVSLVTSTATNSTSAVGREKETTLSEPRELSGRSSSETNENSCRQRHDTSIKTSSDQVTLKQKGSKT